MNMIWINCIVIIIYDGVIVVVIVIIIIIIMRQMLAFVYNLQFYGLYQNME